MAPTLDAFEEINRETKGSHHSELSYESSEEMEYSDSAVMYFEKPEAAEDEEETGELLLEIETVDDKTKSLSSVDKDVMEALPSKEDALPALSYPEPQKVSPQLPKLSKAENVGIKHIQKAFKLAPEEAYRRLIEGSKFIGLDGWHLDAEKRSLYLFIFKDGQDPLGFKDGLRTLTTRGFDFLFADETPEWVLDDSESKQSSFEQLFRMKSFLLENRFVISQVFVHLVFDGKPSLAIKSELLNSIVESLESKKFQLDDFFGNSVALAVEYRSTESEAVSIASHGRKTHRYPLALTRPMEIETPNGEMLRVGGVKLVDLLDIHSKMGSRFFSRNIRSGLSTEKPTNRSIQKTIENIVIHEKMDPEAFIFHHNGITIAAESFENKRGGTAQLTEPRLLNGAQSVSSLAAFVKKWEGDEKFEKNRHLLERISVLGKVISTASSEFVSEVTISNNRQNPVEPWNLRANEEIQLELQEKFVRELGLYYERQENAFAALSNHEFEVLGVDRSKPIEMKRLAQTFLACQGEIDKMNRLRAVFESDSTFKETFKESYLKKNAKKILVAYKIQFRLQAAAKEVSERYPEKYHWLPKAKNLLWALLIQAILNDEDAQDIIETFGDNLKLEHDFTDLLKDFTSKKIRMVLSVLAADDKNAEQIALANFSFLKSNKAFQSAMTIAEEKFSWKKMSL